MTTANQITIGRILSIPVFVAFALYYAESVEDEAPNETYRWLAVTVFVLASISDGLDGWIARRFNQHSRLGIILDPLADKALVLAAIITLSLSSWPSDLPLWFPILVIGRDAVLIAGALLMHYVCGDLRIRPHWTGKVATFFLMVTLGWVMLGIQIMDVAIFVTLAGIFTFASGVIYIADGTHQIKLAGHGEAERGE